MSRIETIAFRLMKDCPEDVDGALRFANIVTMFLMVKHGAQQHQAKAAVLAAARTGHGMDTR